jgi:hypothetical protein
MHRPGGLGRAWRSCRVEHARWGPGSAGTADQVDVAGQWCVRDISVETPQGIQRLPLGRDRHLALGGQTGENMCHSLNSERSWKGLADTGTERTREPVCAVCPVR